MSGMRPYLSFMGRLGSQCLRQISPSAQLMALLEEEGCHSALSSSGRVLRRATGLRSILDRSHPDVARLQGRYGHHHDGLMQRCPVSSPACKSSERRGRIFSEGLSPYSMAMLQSACSIKFLITSFYSLLQCAGRSCIAAVPTTLRSLPALTGHLRLPPQLPLP